MRFIVFHYHLQPGGVTDVIVESIRAVCAHTTEISSVILVTGRPDNADTVASRLADGAPEVRVDLRPEIDYTDPDEPTEVAMERAAAIEQVLLAHYASDDALWWVHNYHVGKNPALTLALIRIAARRAAPRMVLHIHDFAEHARYENLAYLRRVAGESPYPAGASVRYVVINGRDHRLLVEAGIPAERVALLPNPVRSAKPRTDEMERPNRDRLVAGLAAFAREEGFRFHPGGPLLLYPVRSIRRKNVLEIATIARLVPKANLIVTLPGTSESESPYSDLVRYAYDDRRIHGVFGIGRNEARYGFTFDELCLGADLVVSSSVQEGFGLTFVNALRWRVPLLARRLDVLDGIDSIFEGYPARFYRALRVPLRAPSVTSMVGYLRLRYGERIESVRATLGSELTTALEDELERLLDGPTIDFSFLPPQMQLALLGDVRDHAYAEEIRGLNPGLLEEAAALPGTAAPARDEAIAEVLGPDSFASRFLRHIESSNGATDGSLVYDGVGPALVRRFATLGNLRLLLGPVGRAEGH